MKRRRMDLLDPVIRQSQDLQPPQPFEAILQQAGQRVITEVERAQLFLRLKVLRPERVESVVRNVQHLQLVVEPERKVDVRDGVRGEIDVSYVRVQLNGDNLEGRVDAGGSQVGLAGTQWRTESNYRVGELEQ